MANSPGIQFPNIPQPEQEKDPRIQARGNLFQKLLGDPRVLQFLLSMGANLSQPRLPGQSEFQGFTESLQSGFQGLELARQAQAERERQGREERRKAIEASNKAVVAQGTLDTGVAQREGLRASAASARATAESTEAKTESFVRGEPGRVDKAEADLESVRTTNKIAQETLRNAPAERDRLISLADTAARNALSAEARGVSELEQARLNAERSRSLIAVENKRLDILSANAVVKGSPLQQRAAAGVKQALPGALGEPDFFGGGLVDLEIAAREKSNTISLARAKDIGVGILVSGGETDKFAFREYTNGILGPLAEPENGKPVFIAVRPFRGTPSSGGPWQFVSRTVPAIKGEHPPAMRLETPEEVFYIVVEDIATELGARDEQ